MLQEKILREAVEKQIENGWILSREIWFQFRNGRNPPKASPWGCVLIASNTTNSGNFLIPSGNWWSSVRETLGVSNSWLEMFASGFDDKAVSSMWLSQASQDELEAYQLGKKFAENYLSNDSRKDFSANQSV